MSTAPTTVLLERPAPHQPAPTPPAPVPPEVGPPTLAPELLRYEQHVTLNARHERPGLVLRTMFGSIDLLYGRRGRRLRRWRHRIAPRLLALPWQAGCWLLHLARPALGYRLNAAFEAHAERTYMAFVAEHPETERQVSTGPLADRWPGRTVTVADLLRQIGHDERRHRLDSERAAREEESGRRR